MTPRIIGVGNIGGRLARALVRGGVPAVLAYVAPISNSQSGCEQPRN
jgi:predicted dinucleotide-binding enzyme